MLAKQSPSLAEVFSENSWDSRYTVFQDTTSGSQIGRSANTTYPWGFNILQHVDVRTFNATTNPLLTKESWTVVPGTSFTLGPDATWNNWSRLTATLSTGTTTFTSIAKPVDLTGLTTPSLTLSLPSYPLTSISSATLSLSSDGFATQSTVQFANSTTALVNGDSAATWLLSSFTGIDLTKVNGVKLSITTTAPCTFYAAAIRVIGPQWVQSNIDFDTWNGALRQPIALSGPVVPIPANKTVSPVWYAGTGSTSDPQPINARFGVVFNTGALAGTNTFSMNMRGVQGTDTSQLLMGSSTQAQLAGPQPGLINTAEIPRRMSDLQGLPMSVLEGQSMLNLDATAESVSNTWMSLSFTWGSSSTVQISNSVRINPYTWVGSTAPTWVANTWYLAVLELADTSARVRVLQIDQTTLQIKGSWASNTLFDTGKLSDSYQFIRRAGRIGWNATLNDGATQIRSIRPMSLTYAQYQSAQLNSNKPVSGASINVRTSPEMELFTSWSTLSSGVVIAPDKKRTLSGSSTKVTVPGSSTSSVYSIRSNTLSQDAYTGIVDMTKTEIDVSVWFLSAALAGGARLSASLVALDNGYSTPLAMPQITPGQWQDITFNTPPELQSGLFYLQIGCSSLISPVTFWIDNVSVAEKSVSWAARPSPTSPWVPFDDVLNDDSAGVVFPAKGTQLQVRGRAHRQDSAIMSPPKIIPLYAKLGKAQWPEDTAKNSNPFVTVLATTTSLLNNGTAYTSIPIAPFQNSAILSQNLLGNSSLTINYLGQQQTFAYTGGVIANGSTSLPGVTLTPNFTFPVGSTITILGAPWTSTNSGRNYTFTSSLAVAGNNAPIAYLWSFSDGTQLSGGSVTHTFSSVAAANTNYNVTLTVVDIYGGRSTLSKVINVA